MLRKHRHTIKLKLPAAEAIHQHTPESEEARVDDWVPEYVHPTSKTMTQGIIFVAEHGGEPTYSSCLSWERETDFVKFARLISGSLVSLVSVQLTASLVIETQLDVTCEVKPLVEKVEGIPTQEQFSESIGSSEGSVEAFPRI